MGRGNTDLSNYEYDNHLSFKSKSSKSAARELQQRNADRKGAHDRDGVGYHFGIAPTPVKVERKEDLRKVLDKHGLMLEVDVKKDLKRSNYDQLKAKGFIK